MHICRLLLYFSFIAFINALRLCDSMLDYNIPFSSSCYNSDIDEKNVSQIIRDWGFQTEEYRLQTSDGYNLLINRGYRKTEVNETKNVVVLSHGMYLNGLTFVVRGNQSLGYNFINEGYDVWIPNYRGTRYSRSHVSLSPDEYEFWDFSYQEVAIYDVRETLEFINNITNQKALYIGYSAGSTFGVIYTSLYPEESQKNLLATYYYSTAVYWNHSPSIYQLIKYFYPILNPIFKGLLHGEFIPHIRAITRFLCTGNSFKIYLCEIPKSLVAGFDYSGMDPVGTVLLNSVVLDSTSWKTLVHFLQNMLYKNFSMFNYGSEKNLQIYGQKSPPSYNISRIAVPVGLIVAQNDFLSATEDVDRFYNELSSNLKQGYTVIDYSKFMHLDYIQVKDINERFTLPLLNGVANLISSIEN